MTINALFIMVLIVAIVLLGVIIFLVFQFSNTSSRLFKIIESRINLNKVVTEIDIVEDREEKE